MLVLGIETSCDETAAAVVEDGRVIRSNVVASQDAIHKDYGGVVPELASREHMRAVLPVIDRSLRQAGITLQQVEGIAVTQGPGLLGSLLIGLCAAKSLATVRNLPLVGVDHLEAHVAVNFLGAAPPDFPFTALVVSGGHTNLYHVTSFFDFELLGRTRDDAAGEAFDKTAKFLGLGYPGGVVIDRMAREGDMEAVRFPRAMMDSDSLDFSFSGLKTAVIAYIKKHPLNGARDERRVCDIVAGFQEAVVDVLTVKALRAAKGNDTRRLVLAGGVAANSRLRLKLGEGSRTEGVKLFVPSLSLCTDNAVGVAVLGYHRLCAGRTDSLDLDAYSRVPKSLSYPSSAVS